jgi:mannose-1-phosphate guanylyltransferase
MKQQKVINVILSGGSGTRLWPLSRTSKPKQFLQMFNGKSLFQHTMLRNKQIANEIMLITNENQIIEAEKQAADLAINIAHKIIEPIGRNTAPAIALAALSVDKDAILFVTPSDHMTANQEKYEECIAKAIELAQNNFIVTFGIKPTEPHTGYGYIEFKDENVLKFREKPSEKEARIFLEKGNFYWNSGMFCFKASVFLEELDKYNPKMLAACKNAIPTIKNGFVELDAMKNIPAESIDYAILEHSKIIKTIASNFYWTDLGSFDAIIKYFEEGNNVNNLELIQNEKGNSFVFSSKKVVGAAIHNIIVVDTEDCILILPKGKSDLVKEVYNIINESDSNLI